MSTIKRTPAIIPVGNFYQEDLVYEMVVTDDGETWVNCWLDWKETLTANNREIAFPVHLIYQCIDGQIVRGIGLWDPTEVVLALQEIEANNNRSADAKVGVFNAYAKKIVVPKT